MKNVANSPINGVFASSRRGPPRIVFRRKLNYKWDRYDVFKPWDKIDGVVEVIKQLAKEHEDFSESIIKIDKIYLRTTPQRKNRYIDFDRDNLYTPRRSDLTSMYSRLIGDLWIIDNINYDQKIILIKEACEAAKVEFGTLSSLKW